jgi:hypothetical protein
MSRWRVRERVRMKQRPCLGREPSCPLLKPEPFALADVLGDGLGRERMPQSRVEGGPRLGLPRILVVEDEALIRFAMAEALRELGASVVEAASADEAWQSDGGGIGRLGFHRSSDAGIYDGRSTRNPD